MPFFDVKCCNEECGKISEHFCKHSEIAEGLVCSHCAGTKHTQEFTLALHESFKYRCDTMAMDAGDGIFRMEVLSRDVGEIKPGTKGERLQVINDRRK